VPQGRSTGLRYELAVQLVGKGNTATLHRERQRYLQQLLPSTTKVPRAQARLRTFEDAGHTFTFVYPTIFTLSGGEMGYTQNWRTDATTTGLILSCSERA
jgi:hypothetical protein